MIDNFLLGFAIIWSWKSILCIVCGSCFGLVMGSIPGLTATMACALLLPFTFDMEFVPSIMLLIGAYKGGIFGGSITAILLNTPGTPASAATTLDGFAMTKQGKGVKALKMAKYSSILGDIGSDIVLIAVAAPLASIALKFGPPEIAMLIFFSLTIIASVSGKSMMKGLISAALGLLVASVGLDPIMTTRRFCFGLVDLDGGLPLIPVLIGLFALSEVFLQLGKKGNGKEGRYAMFHSKAREDNRVSWKEFRPCLRTILRGSAIGTGIGIIPGIGTGIAAFISYGRAKRASKNPEGFGKGSLEGIAASESGNSAVVGATFIPMLTLGIPGDLVAAVIMGAFMIQGFIPGPLLFVEHADMMYAIFIGFFICDIVYFIIGSIFMRYAAYLSKVPRDTLFPIVFLFCAVGSYAISNSLFDVGIVVFFGVLGYYMIKFGFAVAPFLIAFLLGPIAETAMRQALLISSGSLSIFVTKPISLLFFIVTLLSIAGILYSHFRKRKAVLEQT